MITLTRSRARSLRSVLRRSTLGLIPRGPVPPLYFRAEGGQLRAHYRYGALAVEHITSCDPECTGIVVLPLDALAEFEGRDETAVALEADVPERTTVRWVDRGIPQVREYTTPALDTPGPMPATPRFSWSDISIGLLDALAEASETACDESTRYALGCVLLRGDTGEIAATDGHQLLVQGGFCLPWTDDVLIQRSRIFASRALPRDQPLAIGKTETHIVLRSGPWTIFQEVHKDARFPRVEAAIPSVSDTATRLQLNADDVRFLLPALGRLPGRDEDNAPVTLDLNGQIAVRARDVDTPSITELVLTRSSYDGAPIRVSTNRAFLSRALRLAFTEIEVSASESPLICRGRFRTYAWQPLAKDSAIAPSDGAIRIESTMNDRPTPVAAHRPTKTRTTVNEPRPLNGHTTRNGDTPAHSTPAENPTPDGLAALIREAEALHEVLSDARTRTSRLVVALRRHRKRERLVSTTLAALKGLKLPEVVA
jgi:hypothetical protein